MKLFIKRSWVVCIALTCMIFSSMALAQKGGGASVEDTYTVWKDSGFLNFIVDKNVNFGKYKKIIVFPLNYNELKIAKKAKTKITRNWSDFVAKDMPAISEQFTKIVNVEFAKSDTFSLTEKGGADVLVAEFRAIEVMPKAFRDASLSTVGRESIEIVGTLTYEVALVDSQTRKLVAMIDDDLLIALRGSTENNRIAHSRAWRRSFEHILGLLHEKLVLLASESPLNKK